MAEIELSALSKQCLDRRIPDIDKLKEEINIWQQKINAIRATIRWKFNKDNARTKLKRHYLDIVISYYYYKAMRWIFDDVILWLRIWLYVWPL